MNQLQVGDVFYIKVLGETLAYEVKEINTVLPHETELLELVQGEDLCTLVTCTPFGVNSHRLLVRGSRVSYQAAEELTQQPGTVQTEPVKSTWMEQYCTTGSTPSRRFYPNAAEMMFGRSPSRSLPAAAPRRLATSCSRTLKTAIQPAACLGYRHAAGGFSMKTSPLNRCRIRS